MKKIINNPEDVVLEMCSGMVLSMPDLELLPKYKIIKKKEVNQAKVTLISGGGSGHEPAHAGYVGKGMLDAAVCGDVFASPSQIQVYQAIKTTASKKGTLLIIKNYSGDMMNFQNAAFLAQTDGIDVDFVKVSDDIAVEDSLYTVGRRGVAGTVFVHKIAGAAAEEGVSLQEVKRLAQLAVDNVRSIGFALSSCTVPAKGTPTFELLENEIEYGVGIHGEPGIRREELQSAADLAGRSVEAILTELGIDDTATEIALMVNGFGATPLMELYLLCNGVARELTNRNIKINRIFTGNYMTSIDMSGASISIMKLNRELKTLLNRPCEAAAFRVDGGGAEIVFSEAVHGQKDKGAVSYRTQTDKKYSVLAGNVISFDNMIYIVDKMSEIIIRNEQRYCELDSHAGDGDFGMSISKGFRMLKDEWNEILQEADSISEFLERCSIVIMENCGGASGPIWGFAFKYASNSTKGKKVLTISDFAQMLQSAVRGVQDVGERSFGRGAVIGDKTLIDALVPCADAWMKCSTKDIDISTVFIFGADAAVDGARNTEKIIAKMGRAGTVGERSLGHPDAGAFALGEIFTMISKSLISGELESMPL